jgi:hypothetical protein
MTNGILSSREKRNLQDAKAAARSVKWLKGKITATIKELWMDSAYKADPDISLDFILKRVDRDLIYEQIWAINAVLKNEPLSAGERQVVLDHREMLLERLELTEPPFNESIDRHHKASWGCANRPHDPSWLYPADEQQAEQQFKALWKGITGGGTQEDTETEPRPEDD